MARLVLKRDCVDNFSKSKLTSIMKREIRETHASLEAYSNLDGAFLDIKRWDFWKQTKSRVFCCRREQLLRRAKESIFIVCFKFILFVLLLLLFGDDLWTYVSYLSWKSEKNVIKLFLGISYYIKLKIIFQLFIQ